MSELLKKESNSVCFDTEAITQQSKHLRISSIMDTYTCTDNTIAARTCTKRRKTESNGEEYLLKALCIYELAYRRVRQKQKRK
jgi:hypothetical protein